MFVGCRVGVACPLFPTVEGGLVFSETTSVGLDAHACSVACRSGLMRARYRLSKLLLCRRCAATHPGTCSGYIQSLKLADRCMARMPLARRGSPASAS